MFGKTPTQIRSVGAVAQWPWTLLLAEGGPLVNGNPQGQYDPGDSENESLKRPTIRLKIKY